MQASPIRVVVWSTGGVGSIAVDAVHGRPDLELVGVWVHSPDKVGRDAGELAGVDPIGVTATNDADALIASLHRKIADSRQRRDADREVRQGQPFPRRMPVRPRSRRSVTPSTTARSIPPTTAMTCRISMMR